VKMQQANGSWTLSDVAKITSITLDKLKGRLSSLLPNSELAEIIWATALMISVLELSFPSSHVEWRLMAQKANKFVVKNSNSLNASVDDVKSEAINFIKINRV